MSSALALHLGFEFPVALTNSRYWRRQASKETQNAEPCPFTRLPTQMVRRAGLAGRWMKATDTEGVTRFNLHALAMAMG